MDRRAVVCAFIVAALTPGTLIAQQPPGQNPRQAAAPAAPMQGRVFVLKHALPRHVLPVLTPLTSGKDAAIAGSDDTMTISVRDFPENLAAIEAAVKLLDKPVSGKSAVSLDLRISLIAASLQPQESGPAVPQELVPVVEQLRRTLSFKNYRYVTTLTQRTVDFGRVGASGPTAAFFPSRWIDKPAYYEYHLGGIHVGSPSDALAHIQVGEFHFSAKIPVVANPKEVAAGAAPPDIEYQTLSLTTGLSLREGEQVVVGTTGVVEGDKALIVVVSMARAKG